MILCKVSSSYMWHSNMYVASYVYVCELAICMHFQKGGKL